MVKRISYCKETYSSRWYDEMISFIVQSELGYVRVVRFEVKVRLKGEVK